MAQVEDVSFPPLLSLPIHPAQDHSFIYFQGRFINYKLIYMLVSIYLCIYITMGSFFLKMVADYAYRSTPLILYSIDPCAYIVDKGFVRR